MEQPQQQQHTDPYRAMMTDPILNEESRTASLKAFHAREWPLREYQKLAGNTDITDEARARMAQAAYEKHKPKVEATAQKAKETILKQAKSAETSSLPRPKGESLTTNDPTRLLLVQNEMESLRRKADKRRDNPVFKSAGIIDFLRSEYSRALEDESTVQGATRCSAVLRFAEEEGIDPNEVVNPYRSDQQIEAQDRARRLMWIAQSVSTETPQPFKSLQPPRRVSRRPEQRRPTGNIFTLGSTRGESVYKPENQSATLGSKPTARRKKRAWK